MTGEKMQICIAISKTESEIILNTLTHYNVSAKAKIRVVFEPQSIVL